MTGTELDVVYSTSPLPQRQDYARALAAAGTLLPKALLQQGPEHIAAKVFLILETGSMLSIHPVAALQGVNVIEGKPTISPALMSGLVHKAGFKLWIDRTGTVEGGDYTVRATLVRPDDPDHPNVDTWTVHRAVRAGLCEYVQDGKGGPWRVVALSEKGKPLPWQVYTEAMVEHRVVSSVCRSGAQDVLFGLYTPEELGATVNEAGEMVDITATAVDRTPERQNSDVVDAEVVDETTGEINPGVPVRPAYDAEVAERWDLRVRSVSSLADLRRMRRVATDERVLWPRDGGWDGIDMHEPDDGDPDGPLTLAQVFRRRANELEQQQETGGDAA